ncbi:MAG: hypothetical protein Ct9H300mP7_5950 [Verrucomicrobiota bacterium]|nr:MAG: hypothetical protein Ct9H300mP7_5950 [Verrucomicrobiota bacterium]
MVMSFSSFTARHRLTNSMPRAMSSRKTVRLTVPTPTIAIKNCARSTVAQPRRRGRYREYKKHQERQRRYLNKRKESDPKKRNENLVTRNVDLFEDKFAPRLVGEEKVNGRDAYVISLKPNKKYKHKSRIVNRIMDQLDTRVWVDKEEFQISQLSTRLSSR